MKKRDGFRGNRGFLFRTEQGPIFNAYRHWWMVGTAKWYNRRLRPVRGKRTQARIVRWAMIETPLG
jgi:hypothetical protein